MYLLHSVYSNNSSVLLDDLSRVLRILRKLAFNPGILLPVNVCVPRGVPEFDLRLWLLASPAITWKAVTHGADAACNPGGLD